MIMIIMIIIITFIILSMLCTHYVCVERHLICFLLFVVSYRVLQIPTRVSFVNIYLMSVCVEFYKIHLTV